MIASSCVEVQLGCLYSGVMREILAQATEKHDTTHKYCEPDPE